jgi:hypothetical protein
MNLESRGQYSRKKFNKGRTTRQNSIEKLYNAVAPGEENTSGECRVSRRTEEGPGRTRPRATSRDEPSPRGATPVFSVDPSLSFSPTLSSILSASTRSDLNLIACSRSSADLLCSPLQIRIRLALVRLQAFYTFIFLFFAMILLVHLRPCSVTVLYLVLTRNGRVYFCCPCFVAFRTMVALLRSLFVTPVSAGSDGAETACCTAPHQSVGVDGFGSLMSVQPIKDLHVPPPFYFTHSTIHNA